MGQDAQAWAPFSLNVEFLNKPWIKHSCLVHHHAFTSIILAFPSVLRLAVEFSSHLTHSTAFTSRHCSLFTWTVSFCTAMRCRHCLFPIQIRSSCYRFLSPFARCSCSKVDHSRLWDSFRLGDCLQSTSSFSVQLKMILYVGIGTTWAKVPATRHVYMYDFGICPGQNRTDGLTRE